MTMSWKARKAAAVLLLLGAAASCSESTAAPSASTPVDPRQFVVERMQGFLGSVERAAVFYATFDEALPNVRYQHMDGRTSTASDLAVVGTVSAVEKGKGFKIEGDDAAGGIPVAFDAKEARWWSLHMTIDVERTIGSPGAEAPKQVRVAMSSPPPEQFEVMADGLKSLGRIIVLLKSGSELVAYDPSLYVIAEDGALLATVAVDGSLDVPFVAEARSTRLLAPTPRLTNLERAGALPRAIPLTGPRDQERRVDGKSGP